MTINKNKKRYYKHVAIKIENKRSILDRKSKYRLIRKKVCNKYREKECIAT